MVMLGLLRQVSQQCGWQLEVACVDHGLRPFQEETRVLTEACGSSIPLHFLTLEPGLGGRAHLMKASVEEQARSERYEALRKLAKDREAVAVFLAHHANDQAETLLLNLLRGCGPTGLGGMPAVREELFVRPLLDVSREALRQWGVEQGIAFVEDPSNATPQYRRNRIRHEVLPRLQAVEPAAVELLTRTARLARKEAEQRDTLAASWVALCWRGKGEWAHLSIPLIQRTPVPEWTVRKALTDFLRYPPSEAALERVMGLLEGSEAREAPLGRGFRAVREMEELRFLKPQQSETEPEAPVPPVLVPGPGRYAFGRSRFVVTRMRWALGSERNVEIPAYAGLLVSLEAFPLTIDRWQPGERMSLWGFSGHRLVSDLLSEMGIPKSARAGWSVVRDRDGAIVWLCSIRRGNSYPVTPVDEEACLVELASSRDELLNHEE